MLDRSPGTAALEGVQHLGHGSVPDGVDRALEAGVVGTGHEAGQLVRLDDALAPRVQRVGGTGEGLAAPGRAGVERAVRDDLERTHRHEAVGVEDVAGAVPGLEDPVQTRGVGRGTDTQAIEPLGDPPRPLDEAVVELHVDDADDPLRRGLTLRRLRGRPDPLGVHRQLAEPEVDLEPLVLVDRPWTRIDAEQSVRRGAQPARVAVTADENGRTVPDDRVELGRARQARPLPQPEAEPLEHLPDDGSVGSVEVRPDPREDLVGPVGAADVEAGDEALPLRHVDVGVPQPRHRPPASRVVHLGAVRTQGRTDLVDDAVDDVEVDEGRFGGEPLVDPRGGSEVDDPHVAQEEPVGHERHPTAAPTGPPLRGRAPLPSLG